MSDNYLDRVDRDDITDLGYQPWQVEGISELAYCRRRCVELQTTIFALAQALEFIRDCEDDGEEMGPIVTVSFLKEQARITLQRYPI